MNGIWTNTKGMQMEYEGNKGNANGLQLSYQWDIDKILRWYKANAKEIQR